MSPPHEAFLNIFFSLPTYYNVIRKHHNPWNSLPNVICHFIHHQRKEEWLSPLFGVLPCLPLKHPSVLLLTSHHCPLNYFALFWQTSLLPPTFSYNAKPLPPAQSRKLSLNPRRHNATHSLIPCFFTNILRAKTASVMPFLGMKPYYYLPVETSS